MKPKDSFEGLYQRIADRGITFNYHSKDEVIDFLSQRNYYYRLISYRKNFKKENNLYVGLDFKALCDMASIDTYLREYLFCLCLDIEHIAKTYLMTHLTKNSLEDGYSILDEFGLKYPTDYQIAMRHFEKNGYKKDMYRKRQGNVSVWVFLEVIDFGTLIKFLNFYTRKYPDFKDKLNHSDLKFVKNIRNACAHNDIYFINIFVKNSDQIQSRARSRTMASKVGIQWYYLKNPKIHDLVVLFSIHQSLCSNELNRRRHNEGIIVLERATKNKDLYIDSNDYHKGFRLIRKCIDHLKK